MHKLHKILILGAGEGQIPLIRYAKQNDWLTIVVSPQGDYPGFALADLSCYADISNRDEVLQIAIQQSIQAIATDQTDVSVPTVQYVCEKLGLPCIKCRDIENFQLKSHMRDVCMAYGIPTIPYRIVDNVQDAVSFFDGINGDSCILKPIDSQGSRGIHKVSSRDEILTNFSSSFQYSKSGHVIIEKFIAGQEIEVDSIVYGGIVQNSTVGDISLFKTQDTYSSYERVYPSRLCSSVQKLIMKRNQEIITALGMVDGWTHGEYRLSNDGELYLLEIGARGGGNFVGSDIVRLTQGLSTDEMAFRMAIGDSSFLTEKHTKKIPSCACKSFYVPEGIILSVSIDDMLMKSSNIVSHNLSHLRVGCIVGKNTDKTSRYTLVVQADNYMELRELLDLIPKHISVKVQTENGIQDCIWK